MRITSGSPSAPADPAQAAAALSTEFRAVFDRDAAGVWFAPGRANLNGEHIDFHGGRCLPMALGHGTYVAAAARDDSIVRLRTLDPELDAGVQTVHMETISAKTEPAESADPAEPTDAAVTHSADWTRYVTGVLWALTQLGDEHTEFSVPSGFGADLLVSSTLPIGGGLSSSAALECASALAFTALATPLGAEHPAAQLNTALTDAHRRLLAAACMRAEVEVVGAGTGGLDQTVSLRGAAGHLLSLDCRDFTVAHLSLEPLLADYMFIAVDTGQAHWLGDGQFGARRADAEAAAELLGLHRLRDALPESPTSADVDSALAQFDRSAGSSGLGSRDAAGGRRRLRHALTEMLRSEQLHRLLSISGDDAAGLGARLGEILSAGHASMRDDAEVSFPVADAVVEAAVAAGASGARLIGGGFGGSVLVLLPRSATQAVTEAVSAVSADIHTLEPVPSAAARAL